MIFVLKGQIKVYKKKEIENYQLSGFCLGKFFFLFNLLNCFLS